MLSFFQRIWTWLTGGTKVVIPPVNPPAPASGTPAAQPSSPASSTTSSAGGLVLELRRTAAGSQLRLGDQVVDCLEGPVSALAPGTYALALRAEGGLHAAYLFRFPELHKGMVQIQDSSSKQFRYLRLGEQREDAQGGLVIGHIGHYLDLYLALAEPLLAGKTAHLRVG